MDADLHGVCESAALPAAFAGIAGIEEVVSSAYRTNAIIIEFACVLVIFIFTYASN